MGKVDSHRRGRHGHVRGHRRAVRESVERWELEGGQRGAGYRPFVYRVEHTNFSTKTVEDEIYEPIIYLPTAPAIAALVDGLEVHLTSEGQWVAPSHLWAYLLGPLAVLSANAACAWAY